MKILVASVVDPSHEGGGGSALRGLLHLLESVGSDVRCISGRPGSPSLGGGRLGSLVRSAVSSRPSKAVFQENLRKPLKTAVKSDGPWDAALLFGADLLGLIDVLPASTPRILVTLNLEYELFEQQIGNLRWIPPGLRWLLERDAAKLRKFEEEGMKRARNVLFLSARDCRVALESGLDLHTLTIPPLFEYPSDVRDPASDTQEPLSLGFMANFGWWPNQVGLRWFTKEVLPRTRSTFEVHLFGHDSERSGGADPRITRHGFVQDRCEIWQTCDLMICPVVAGAGVPVKLAEVIYNGMPVLTTGFAAHGLSIDEGEGIAVRNRAEDWAAFIDSGARELALQQPAEEVREMFDRDRYREPLLRYLREAGVDTNAD